MKNIAKIVNQNLIKENNMSKLIARVKFLIWVYSYRAKRFIENKFGNARLESVASQTNKNLIQNNKLGGQIEHLHNSIYYTHDRIVGLEERIEKLESKVRRLSKKEKVNEQPKKRASVRKKRS